MPIIEIDAVGLDQSGITHGTVRGIADALGEVMGMGPGKIWVRLRTLPGGAYAENGTDLEETPEPVFVRITRSTVPTGDALEREIVAATRAVAAALGRREQEVHVEVAPSARGRIAFGGRLSR